MLPILIAVAVSIGVAIGRGVAVRSDKARLDNVTKLLDGIGGAANDKISTTFTLIKSLYVEDVNIDSLADNLMPELMAQLDPHSVYIPPRDLEKANEALEGEIEGIGVTFNMMTDTVVVLSVILQGPSYKAGVQNGDRIIRIGDSLVAGQKIPQDDVVKMLRGKRGSQVTLSVERQGISDLIPISITRDKIPLKSIDAAFMIRPGVGFIKLSTFARTTHSEIRNVLTALDEQGMEKLIFDLRGNSGGYLDQAIKLANEFLPEGALIVYTEDRVGKQTREYANGRGGHTGTEIAVLIDEGSASSSEILAGALQDNDRGTVVGRRSFGKGLVQQQIPFADGSAIRLTTAKYYTPTGRSIQKPYSNGEYGYEDDIYLRYMHNEMFSADSVRFDESLKYTTPAGKTVYGGGGIMPDVFVPMDTTNVTNYFVEARGRNYIYIYSRNFADRHREEINAVQTVDDLDRLLADDGAILDDFVRYAASQGLKPDWAQITASRELLIAYLRSYIGRNSPLEEVGFYANMYAIDNNILEALELLD